MNPVKQKKLDWEACYRILRNFRNQHGHLKISPAVPDYNVLNEWMRGQRTCHALLKQEQIEKLLDLGMDFGCKTRWYHCFFRLRDYLRKHGACFPTDSQGSVGTWLDTQRTRRKRGILEAFQIAWLDSLGMPWNGLENLQRKRMTLWNNRFLALQKFVSKHRRFPRTDGKKEEVFLYTWVVHQRDARRKGILSSQQIKQLDKLGMYWEIKAEEIFIQRVNELKAFKAQHGHCRVPGMISRKYSSLGHWVKCIRGSKNQLNNERRRQLDELGFEWKEHRQTAWDIRCAELANYIKKYGRFPSALTGHTNLEAWVSNQRVNRSTLTREQRQKLDALGIAWNPRDEQWNRRYIELCRFQKRFGHCRVPPHNPKFTGLSSWLSSQRRRRFKMNSGQRKQLDDIGVEWTITHPFARQQRMKQLEGFFLKHGHCNVSYSDDKSLARWLSGMRRQRERFSADIVRRLEAMGMDWKSEEDRRQEKFEKRLKELAAFRQKHGHCRVARNIDYELNEWVQMQKRYLREGKLPAERKKRLDELGFDWGNWGETRWEQKYRKLAAYHHKFGNCEVPYKHDGSLAYWVRDQKAIRRNRQLSAERIQKLNKIGFCWTMRR